MRRNLLCLVLLLICVLPIACQPTEVTTSENHHLSDGDHDQLLTASQVLEQSLKKMKTFQGYQWKIEGKQEDPKKNDQIYQFDIVMDYVNEGDFYAKRTVSDMRMATSSEIYGKAPYIYLLDGISKRWVKLQASSSFDYDLHLSFDRRWADPSYVFQLMQKEEQQLKLEKKDNEYQLKLNLSDPNKIKPFVKYIEENPQTNGKQFNSQVDYHSFEVTLTIDQASLQLKEMKSLVHYTYPSYMPSEVELKEQWHFIWQKEGRSVEVPPEAVQLPVGE